MAMETWTRECAPFLPNFAVFAILAQVRNTISRWGKEPTQLGRATLVAYEEGSIALGFGICSYLYNSKIIPFTMRATLPNFVFLAVFCPVA